MKRSPVLPVLAMLASFASNAQLVTSTGTHLVATNNASLVLKDISLSNSGIISDTSGSIVFSGTAANTALSASALHSIAISKTGSGGVQLNSNITVKGIVQMNSNVLDLHGFDLNLDTTGVLLGETNTSYIAGATGGYVIRSSSLNAPIAANPGNLGLDITSSANLGYTTVKRGNQPQNTDTSVGIARYYDVYPANNTGLNATVRFHYLDNELGALTENTLKLYTSATYGGNWLLQNADSLNTTDNYLLKSGLTALNRLTLNAYGVPLSLDLISFTGAKTVGGVQLRWIAENEVDIKNYEVEKSDNAISYTRFATVKAISNTSGKNNYTALDARPFSTTGYYRLKMVNNNGSYKYSNTITIDGTKGLPVALDLSPNPAFNNILLSFNSQEEKNITIQILNTAGQVVTSQQAVVSVGSNKVPLDISSLATGMYYLQLDNEAASVVKFIKSN